MFRTLTVIGLLLTANTSTVTRQPVPARRIEGFGPISVVCDAGACGVFYDAGTGGTATAVNPVYIDGGAISLSKTLPGPVLITETSGTSVGSYAGTLVIQDKSVATNGASRVAFGDDATVPNIFGWVGYSASGASSGTSGYSALAAVSGDSVRLTVNNGVQQECWAGSCCVGASGVCGNLGAKAEHGLFTDGVLSSDSSKTAGIIVLSGGTGTATVLSGRHCVCSLETSAGTAAPVCAVSGTVLTATGTGTDRISYVCL